jgi:hypothetical protein
MARLRSVSFLLVCFLICVTVAVPAAAADFWAKKPYQSWSADETQRMMEDSPWATSLTLSGLQNVAGQGANPRGEMEENPSITYAIQFRSARPIREAQIRSSQLSSHYDKMSAEQKAAFDASASKFLDATFPDRILVAITFQSNVQNYESLLRTYWTDQSTGKLSMKVFLNTGTDRLSLMNYSFKNDTFQFTFPRPKELPPDGKISVEFVHPNIERIREQRIVQVFSLKKMLVDGQPAL